MLIIKNFLIQSKHKERDAYIWNSTSAMLNSFQLVIILLVISRIDNIKDAGNFVIAYAIANLLIMIGRYGVRQYQVSDINEQFIFREYLSSRIFTTILMMTVAIIYVGIHYYNGSYDSEKSIVILLVCGLKAVDAFEDVFHGLLQQHDHLEIAGKILTIRLFTYIIECMLIYYFIHDLIITIVICLLTTIALSIILNGSVIRTVSYKKGHFNFTHFKNLTVDCFPIFISTFLQIYMANAPKYSIDIVLTSKEQAEFNYIFMPVFVISLLSTFIYQPLVHKLAIIWNQKDLKKFWLLILRQTVIIAILTLLCMIMGYLLGIPVLSLLYSVDLSAYKSELVILLLGGGLMAAVNFFTMVITVTRYQKNLVWGYLLISLLFLLGGKKAAISYGIMGISSFYTLASACLTFVVIIYICIIVKLSKIKSS
ncbi:lipopolysaccharide biosynthesis protein [Faecalicatena faecalis]|nr:lipopolysaccharide biosynthesis protein [Faecalicatena faecalis]